MQLIQSADISAFRDIRFVLTDMDETLTFNGRLAAKTYMALERLQGAGIKVIPVTAAPAGWCDQMARMWPVDGVIGENGGFFFSRKEDGHGVKRYFWHNDEARKKISERLLSIGEQVKSILPEARFADDQPFRLTSVAFSNSTEHNLRESILAVLTEAGADVTVNNLWLLGWLGGYDKLAMTQRVLKEFYDIDINCEQSSILYSGDSTNDAPLFSFFEHTVGVSTITDYLDQIPKSPRWVTKGPGGAGFVEMVDAVLTSQFI